MAGTNEPNNKGKKWIQIIKNGPYVVHGDMPLVRKTQVVSEFGEPLTWSTGERIETGEAYDLCRCGGSKNKPFCDNSHRSNDFDGTESADSGMFSERHEIFEGGTKIVVKRDYSLCMDAGYCANRLTSVKKMVADTDDTQVRAQVMAMIERCPSGSYSYAIEPEGGDIEPDLPQQIAEVTEITSQGPINGPLWVTGNIPIQRADGRPFEIRNRVTLCGCGLSKNMPLCDGSHRPED